MVLRVIKSHLTFEMLPPALLDTCKVVYVCRNPKDTVVSFYKVFQFRFFLLLLQGDTSAW